MKSFLSFLAVVLVSLACSETRLPTETEFQVQPRFEIGVVQGGCPSPFVLHFFGEEAIDEEGLDADRNGDRLACYLVTHVTDTEVFRTWTDNHIPMDQIGGCPNGFELSFATIVDRSGDRDRNADGFVCSRLSGNGEWIAIDNNHRPQGT